MSADTTQAAEGVAAETGPDEAETERDRTRRIPNGAGFLLTNLIDALAPGKNPLLNLAPVFDAPGTYVYDH